MARPSVLPLPDKQERQIAAGLPTIGCANPSGANRTFLRDFFSLVHAVTGSIYGASTYLQLLKQFAPTRRPSTTTINEELQSYRAAALAAAPAGPPKTLAGVEALQEELEQVRERLAKLESGKQDTDLKLKELHQLLSAAKSGGRDFSAERTKAVASTRTTKSQRNEQDQ